MTCIVINFFDSDLPWEERQSIQNNCIHTCRNAAIHTIIWSHSLFGLPDWQFKFDKVLHNASQEAIYDQCAKPVVEQALEGCNGMKTTSHFERQQWNNKNDVVRDGNLDGHWSKKIAEICEATRLLKLRISAFLVDLHVYAFQVDRPTKLLNRGKFPFWWYYHFIDYCEVYPSPHKCLM